MVSTTGKNGPHTPAKAPDILISGESNGIVRESSSDRLQWDRIESEGNHASRFVHLDTLPRKALFFY